MTSVKRNAMTITTTSLVQNTAFVNAIETMKNFYFEMNPDIDMCYDYICEVAECSSFVADKAAWDMFYDAWESVQYGL